MKKITFARSALIALQFATAAVAQEPLKLESAFKIDDVKFVKQIGTSTVTGSASLRLADGTVKGCAGFNVELLPVAAYSQERIIRTYGNDRQGQILMEQHPPKFTPDALEYHDMVIKGACDPSGTFTFSNVPGGSYFVIAFIIWDDPSGDTPRKTGGGVMKRIEVPAGARVEALLSD